MKKPLIVILPLLCATFLSLQTEVRGAPEGTEGKVKLEFSQVVFNADAGGAFDSATVSIRVISAPESSLASTFFQLTVRSVHSPEEAKQRARELLKQLIPELAAAVEKLDVSPKPVNGGA